MVKPPEPDWYLQAWMTKEGKLQGHLVTQLGWHKTTAHRLWHGRQPYRRDLLNQVAEWLGIQPFELLMSPREALALRRLREMAHVIVAEDPVEFEPEVRVDKPAKPGQRRTGTGR